VKQASQSLESHVLSNFTTNSGRLGVCDPRDGDEDFIQQSILEASKASWRDVLQYSLGLRILEERLEYMNVFCQTLELTRQKSNNVFKLRPP